MCLYLNSHFNLRICIVVERIAPLLQSNAEKIRSIYYDLRRRLPLCHVNRFMSDTTTFNMCRTRSITCIGYYVMMPEGITAFRENYAVCRQIFKGACNAGNDGHIRFNQ